MIIKKKIFSKKQEWIKLREKLSGIICISVYIRMEYESMSEDFTKKI